MRLGLFEFRNKGKIIKVFKEVTENYIIRIFIRS